MINFVKAGIKRSLGLHRPGRELRILPDDTFLVSYPKSGNTWVRLLLSNLLSPDRPADLWTVNLLVPELETVTKKHLMQMRRPRIIKSHFPFDPRYPKVIYIVRDPRDVIVSEYHYQRKTLAIKDDCSIADYSSRFLMGKTCPEDGSWGEHVGSWLVGRNGRSQFLLVRYEDLLADTAKELSRMARFLDMTVSNERLLKVVELGSAARMRKLELTQGNALTVMRGRKDIAFVRTAKSGNWRSELPEPVVRDIEALWAPIMQFLGYDLRFKNSTEDQLPFHAIIAPQMLEASGARHSTWVTGKNGQ